jgi:hypothetical protein
VIPPFAIEHSSLYKPEESNGSGPATPKTKLLHMSSSSSNSGSDAESASSTVVYGHEPFITFRSRVLAFAQSNIWTDATPKEIAVERLQGGGFNRIIGLTRQFHGRSNMEIQYILRLPRFEAAQLDNDVAVLRFLHQHCEIPAPKVIMFDGTKDNGLGSQYMLQNRIPGTDL